LEPPDVGCNYGSGEKSVERRCRETSQCSLSPADARQFPPGGRPADERSTGSLLINRFAARRKYRRAPAHKPILAETRRPLIRAGQYKHVQEPVSESDAADEMHRGHVLFPSQLWASQGTAKYGSHEKTRWKRPVLGARCGSLSRDLNSKLANHPLVLCFASSRIPRFAPASLAGLPFIIKIVANDCAWVYVEQHKS